MTKDVYDLESKKDTPEEPLVPENVPAIIRNAERSAGNTAEQLPLFVLSMWLYGCVRPVTAGVMGGIELILIAVYPVGTRCIPPTTKTQKDTCHMYTRPQDTGHSSTYTYTAPHICFRADSLWLRKETWEVPPSIYNPTLHHE